MSKKRFIVPLGVVALVLILATLVNMTGGTSSSSINSSGIPYDQNYFLDANLGQPVDASPYRVIFRSANERRIWEDPFNVWPWDKTKYVVVDITLKNTSSTAVNYDQHDWSFCEKAPSSRSSFDKGRLAPNQELSGSLYFDLTRTNGTCSIEFVPANTPWHVHSGPVPI